MDNVLSQAMIRLEKELGNSVCHLTGGDPANDIHAFNIPFSIKRRLSEQLPRILWEKRKRRLLKDPAPFLFILNVYYYRTINSSANQYKQKIKRQKQQIKRSSQKIKEDRAEIVDRSAQETAKEQPRANISKDRERDMVIPHFSTQHPTIEDHESNSRKHGIDNVGCDQKCSAPLPLPRPLTAGNAPDAKMFSGITPGGNPVRQMKDRIEDVQRGAKEQCADRYR
jgi:hypothetical protein